MTLYQCKCGKLKTKVNSDNQEPPKCIRCKICKSDLATHNHLHDPIKHEYNEDGHCESCGKTRDNLGPFGDNTIED